MSILKEAIVDLKAKHKTNGIKIRRLDENTELTNLDEGDLERGGEYPERDLRYGAEEPAYGEYTLDDIKMRMNSIIKALGKTRSKKKLKFVYEGLDDIWKELHFNINKRFKK